MQYKDGIPERIDTIVLSTQHAPEISLKDLREAVIEGNYKTSTS
jgi:S-adenosylmethionine synthetase